MTFETDSGRAMYCSNCRIAMQLERNRDYMKRKDSNEARLLGTPQKCEKCGKTFILKTGSQKYCEECSQKSSSAKILNNNKYTSTHYDRMTVLVPKGNAAEIKEYAKERGLSVNQLFNIALKEYRSNHKND